jgi:formylglycine-generating enzyme required for sulfatase activity
MVTLTRQHHQAQYFIEPLGEGAELEMTLIPAGTFVMGSPADELERGKSEGPQHEVTVPSFCMGTYPVTQAQWRFVAELPQIETELNPAPARFKGALNPVEQVNWHEAMEFCARLAQHTGRPYRLPSEAEWEYACRAGTTTPFHFGETITTEIANYCGQDREIGGTTYKGSYGAGPQGEFRQKTTPVNHFKIANAFGLCDMHGNVWEWCQDVWHDNYEGAPTNGSAWMEGGNQERRVLRGGSWNYAPRNCRSACRDTINPGNRNGNDGFRVVCSAPREGRS